MEVPGKAASATNLEVWGARVGALLLPSLWKELCQGSQAPISSCGMWGGLYLFPLLLHPVRGAVLVSTRVDSQGLGGRVTLRIGDHLALQVATRDEATHASLTTGT